MPRRCKGNRRGLGPGGECICHECGYTKPHQRGVPCITLKCPKCGATMVRKID